MKKYYSTLIIIVLLFTSTLALAQPRGARDGKQMRGACPTGPMMKMEQMDPPIMGCMLGIELSEEQKSKILKIRVDHQKEMTKLSQDIANIRGQRKLLATSDNFKQSELNDLTKKVSKFHEQKVQVQVKHLRDIRDTLTEDQRLIFDKNVLSDGPGRNSPKGHSKGHSCSK